MQGYSQDVNEGVKEATEKIKESELVHTLAP